MGVLASVKQVRKPASDTIIWILLRRTKAESLAEGSVLGRPITQLLHRVAIFLVICDIYLSSPFISQLLCIEVFLSSFLRSDFIPSSAILHVDLIQHNWIFTKMTSAASPPPPNTHSLHPASIPTPLPRIEGFLQNLRFEFGHWLFQV